MIVRISRGRFDPAKGDVVAAALYGLLPRFAVAGTWAALVVFLALELGWELQQLSQPLFNLSPFAHVHWAIQVTAAPLIWLTTGRGPPDRSRSRESQAQQACCAVDNDPGETHTAVA
jgi:hypothetical protein